MARRIHAIIRLVPRIPWGEAACGWAGLLDRTPGATVTCWACKKKTT